MAATTKFVPRLDAAPAVQPGWRALLLLFVAVCVIEGLVLGVLAARRAVNADEGFYLLAGERVLAGQRPYADFFFPQMPYLAYLEAAVLPISGTSLWAGRVISVVTGALVAGLIAAAAAHRSGRVAVGVAVAALYAAHALLLSYLTIAKPYGVANLAAVSAFLLVTNPGAGVLRALAAGALAGVAAGTRLPSVAVGGVLFVWLLWNGVRPALAFAAGAVLASIPWLWLAAHDPQGFWFGNFEFHALRREIRGVVPIITQKVTVLGKWVLLPQNLLLWLLAAGGVYLQPRQSALAAACALVLAAGYLAATPTYLEYLVQVLPFLLLAGVPTMVLLWHRRAVLALAAAVYAIGLVVARRAAPEESLRGEKERLWNLQTVQAVTTYVRAQSAPGDRILSWWEGYPFLAQRNGFTGVGFWEANVAKKLPLDTRRRFHLLGREEIRSLVEGRQPRLVVFPDGTWDELRDALARDYAPTARFGTIEVFTLREIHG